MKAVADGTSETVQAAVTRLQQALQEVGTAMYQQQQDAGGNGAGGDGAGGDGAGGDEAPSTDEDVVEGEFSEE